MLIALTLFASCQNPSDSSTQNEPTPSEITHPVFHKTSFLDCDQPTNSSNINYNLPVGEYYVKLNTDIPFKLTTYGEAVVTDSEVTFKNFTPVKDPDNQIEDINKEVKNRWVNTLTLNNTGTAIKTNADSTKIASYVITYGKYIHMWFVKKE